MFSITTLFASILIIIYLILTILAGNARRVAKIPIGDGNNESIIKASRAHGSFIEHTVLFLLSFFLLEVNGVNTNYLYIAGYVFVISRILHAIGFYLKSLILKRGGVIVTLVCYISNLVYLIKSLL